MENSVPRLITQSQFPLLLTALLWVLTGCNVNGPGLLTNAQSDDTGGTAPATIQTTSDCQTPPDADEFTDQILRLINIERFDLGAVKLDPQLSAIASRYDCTMISEDFFGHVHPRTNHDVTQRLDEAGFAYNVVGENLAAGFWNAYEITDAWMASETHRRIMLDPAFTHAGIAVRYGGDYGIYCVLILADPAE